MNNFFTFCGRKFSLFGHELFNDRVSKTYSAINSVLRDQELKYDQRVKLARKSLLLLKSVAPNLVPKPEIHDRKFIKC